MGVLFVLASREGRDGALGGAGTELVGRAVQRCASTGHGQELFRMQKTPATEVTGV